MFWPMAQQYRHVIPLNVDLLPANHNLFELWAQDQDQRDVLWAVLNSTVTALSKHQFGRAAGVEGNLKTEVVDRENVARPGHTPGRTRKPQPGPLQPVGK